MKKKLKKSQLRNLRACQKCGKLTPVNKLADYETLLPPDYEKEAILKVCYECDDHWEYG